MNKSNAGELVAVFTDYDTRNSPLNDDNAMRIALTGELAFIELGKITEKSENGVHNTTFVCGDSIGVDAELLLNTLTAMTRHSDRSHVERARNGELPEDHPAWTSVPMTVPVPGVSRRA